MSTSNHNSDEIIDFTSTAYKDECGNFDLVDEITDKLFADDMDEENDVQIIGLYPQSSMATTDKDSQTIVFSKELTLTKIIGIDFNEIPDYLSKTNQSFRTKIYSMLPAVTHNYFEKLQSIAILMYQIMCIEMIHSLWINYRKSGMGELDITLPTNELDRKIWPEEILSLMERYKIKEKKGTTTAKDKNECCLILVNDCLHKLNDKSEEYRRELRLNTSRLSNYTPQLDDMIEKFVQQGLNYFRIEIDCQIALIQYHYIDQILKRQYLIHNPPDIQLQAIERLCQLKYDEEITKHEINLLIETIPIHLSAQPTFNSQSITDQSPLINTIPDSNLQLQLYEQYKTVTKETTTNTLNSYIKSLGEQMDNCQKKFNIEIDNIWKINKSLPYNQELTFLMQNLIDQRLDNITTRIECIYKFKTKLFHIKSNSH